MIRSIIAAVVTIIVGFVGCAIFASWINAPEFGVILAVAVMGAFNIYFNGKRR